MSLRAARIQACLLAGLVCLFAAGTAHAQTATCTNDIDCPGTTCGSQTCVHNSGGSICAEAGTEYPSGAGDGHCATDNDCKCKAQGATCSGFYCTFTVPQDGGSTGTGGTGGTTGSAGTGGGGGGGCSVAGAHTGAASIGIALFAAALMRRRARRRR